ncbi:CDP-alcohol phosphatidyltransferase family protein [Clavibacter michiganensis]|uniref:CDP-alcohol phosphatidyltransferase family protein n=1 Tax=Clavibacter michiganensis TaxID=28447 RepID=UPI0009C8110F|nr:CDP-alcohol phosphatidyltransferase family protein [Clavibacter michiganensis]MBF4637320.1 CDP-alcohol phosphatidyltransferase family protein [Clavibacter michiganensis subsp. michiganensis]MDO4029616.1 CDP-alcohol phosphatidyltransferase family protein [Clavibacter michiganensis]MDO4125236.1 CDP-alcohol phosphatidyltransferase family protein [Clavibacter michiganensis]MDO4140496.1 CDP-alcohol phosphatidyltransferase family protein [Clavibacter michiganensis]MWJ05878.1 CDP-alcohol phosphati
MTAGTAATGARAESYADVVRRLASAQKKAARGAPAYSIRVNRPAGRLLAAWAYRQGLTPNQVTAISAAFTFTGIALIALVQPAAWLGIAVWLLLAVGYAFDSADGQVARLRGGGSLSGEWLDHVVDCIKISSLHLAVLVSLFRWPATDSDAWLLVPVVYAIVAAASFFAMILNDQLKRVHQVSGATAPDAGRSTLLRSLLVIPTDYGFLCIVFALLGAPVVFLAVYTLMMLANAGHLALASVKWFRDMGALDARRAEAAANPAASAVAGSARVTA